MFKHVTGLVPASFTPMHADGSVNLGLIDRYAAHYATEHAAAVFVNGSSGESVSLTTAERLAVARRWLQVAGKNLPIIVHVGGTCLAECRELAADAQKHGAFAIAAMSPCFFKPATVADLVEFCRQLAEAAPKLPFYYYHIPARTGVAMPMREFLPMAAGKIPTLLGVKFTHEDLMDYARCVALMDGRFNMLFGRDEILLAALALGAKGAVGTTYNFVGRLYTRLVEAFQRGDLAEARKEQLRGAESIACLAKGGLAAFKAVMKMIGLDCGPVRPPLTPLSEAMYAQIKGELEKMGFFDWR